MKAAICHTHGASEVLKIEEVDKPVIQQPEGKEDRS